ncbi:hypothetical protein Z517_00885 [Fonsecaea pedrosoi CBS 271.37]|uniref:Cytochrome P450 n=1 Tax=Fonsecaea pedrosoi CBS 271.37 TaxID=1442368 RepID=A0A0D2HM18_9EURO|nr:uncharacterized protein Z517_00885 [Fonsecaea pedrosoi CBS 271.37]KIW85494.1 hypothetical protein Z517_00885 [Fonsecaea pedrosoi CBS 271.37]
MFLLPQSYLSLGAIALVVYSAGWIIYTTYFHPLRHIPGPFLARLSRAWITWHILRGDMEHEQRRLHAAYGPFVRIAPDEVACSDPRAIPVIYPMKAALPKSDFYTMWQNPNIGNFPDHFSQRDEKVHAERRRIVSHVYSLSNILRSEPYIDHCSEVFMERMGAYADADEVVDLGEWLQMYAFDVVGELFFGKMFGFMNEGHDHENWIASLDLLMPFLTITSVIPSYLRTLLAVSAFLFPKVRQAFHALNTLEAAAKRCVVERKELLQNPDAAGAADDKGPGLRRDLLAQMFAIQQSKGADVNFSDKDMTKESYSAILELVGTDSSSGGPQTKRFAGSDTTAIAMRATLYFLMKHPTIYDQVVSEIDQATANGTIPTTGPIAYSQATKLPLLCASIKEAMRLHPSVGLTLPRDVPPQGLVIGDTPIPGGGTRIGMNAAVVHYDRSMFGEDADEFRPERWLVDSTAQMDRCMLHFGAGTRTCLGKNISLSELHKLIPTLLRDFKLDRATEEPWKTYNFFFTTQKGLLVRLRRRTPKRAETDTPEIERGVNL